MELSERLAHALNEVAPLEIRGDKKALQAALHARMGPAGDRPGTSYPAVLGYFSGKTQPSLDWIEMSAAVMGVRAAWLAFESGAPTEEEEQRRLFLGELAAMQEEESRGFHSRLLREMRAPVDYHPRHWTPMLAHIASRLDTDVGTLARILRNPLEVLGIDPGRMTEDTFNDYLATMVPVLLALAAERTAQAPYRNPNEGGNDA